MGRRLDGGGCVLLLPGLPQRSHHFGKGLDDREPVQEVRLEVEIVVLHGVWMHRQKNLASIRRLLEPSSPDNVVGHHDGPYNLPVGCVAKEQLQNITGLGPSQSQKAAPGSEELGWQAAA